MRILFAAMDLKKRLAANTLSAHYREPWPLLGNVHIMIFN